MQSMQHSSVYEVTMNGTVCVRVFACTDRKSFGLWSLSQRCKPCNYVTRCLLAHSDFCSSSFLCENSHLFEKRIQSTASTDNKKGKKSQALSHDLHSG